MRVLIKPLTAPTAEQEWMVIKNESDRQVELSQGTDRSNRRLVLQ